jgi:hypothetical protein
LGEPLITAPSSSTEFTPEICGPVFSWAFPTPWVEMFFPDWYDKQQHEFNSQDEHWWRLIDILEQADKMELLLD